MGQILVRNLSDEVIANLKSVAKARGRSLQGEVKDILEAAGRSTPEQALAEANRIRARFNGRKLSDSVLLIREDRER